MRSMISWWVKIFFHYLLLSLFFYEFYSFLFALHLAWSLNTSVDKKIKCNFYIWECVFHFGLWFKLSIFFSLVLFSLEMYTRSGEKITRKKENVDRLLFKDTLCVTLLQKTGGGGGGGEGGQCQFLGKIASHFLGFHLLIPPLKWRLLYIPPTPFYCNPLPAHPPPF